MEFYQAITNKQRIFREQLIEEIKVITSERELTKTFNEHYISTVEKGSSIKPKDISQHDKNQNIEKTIRETVKSYKNHISVLQITNFCSSSFHVKKKFCFCFMDS